MKNIIYYLKKFGNKTFEEMPFNEVDSLILCQISYLNLEQYVPSINSNSSNVSLINQLSPENIEALCVETLDRKRNKKLMLAMKNTTRYQGLMVNYLQNYFLVDKVEQFCAVTYLFKEFVYVAYRGTDLTLLGWHEDFNMSLLDAVPSQYDATEYLNKVYSFERRNICVGGHSKGGNLALYASLNCKYEVLQHLIKIYDHDGPGFNRDIYNTIAYQKIDSLLVKMTCHQSMIGILMYHSGKMDFVASRSVGIFQHDPYNWKITKTGRFKYVKYPTIVSQIFEKTIRDFLESTSIEERKLFVDCLFKILMERDDITILDIKRHPFRYMHGLRKRYKALPLKKKTLFKRVLKKYDKIWRQNSKYFFSMKRRLGEKYKRIEE